MTIQYSTDNEILEIVDSDDRVIGRATRREIHERGLSHRSVHIFVFNAAGEVFVQRRSRSKDRHPLKLDSSAAGHVDPGESYQATALRELEEELGIRADVEEVLRVGAQPVTDQEHVALFLASTDQTPVLNEAEITWGGFMIREDLSRLMSETPADFVPAFVLLWREFLDLGLRGLFGTDQVK